MSVKFEEVIEDGIIDEVLDGGGKNMEAGILLEADAEQLSGLVKTEADGAGSVYEEEDLGGMELLGEAASQTFLQQPQPITFGEAAASQIFLEQPPPVFASRNSTFLQPQQLLNETIGEVFLQPQPRGFLQQHPGGENLQSCTLSFILMQRRGAVLHYLLATVQYCTLVPVPVRTVPGTHQSPRRICIHKVPILGSRVSDPDSIRSVDPDPYSESGSAKMKCSMFSFES
jgi:hypothetical protein